MDIQSFEVIRIFVFMEEKGKNNRAYYAIVLAAVWIALLIYQLHLAKRVYSNQRELFQIKLETLVTDVLSSVDTLEYDGLDSVIVSGLAHHSPLPPYEIGIYKENEPFLYLTEGANPNNLIELGYHYTLLCLDNGNADLLTLSIYFPGLERKFRIEMILGYSFLVVVLVLILCCFISLFYGIIKQKKINIFREKMVHFITHELKTPLTTIGLATQLLRDNTVQKNAESMDFYLNMIAEEVKSLQRLVDDELTIFRSEGIPKREMADVSIHQVLESVLNTFKLSLEEINAKVDIDLQAKQDVVVGDYYNLHNAFSNLVDNAIKYRSDQLKLTITTVNKDNNIVICVADNGIGIEESNIPLIFESFSRFNTDNEHYVKGFGLGLDYVKHIVEYHKGSIRVESEYEVGAKFYITIPIKN